MRSFWIRTYLSISFIYYRRNKFWAFLIIYFNRWMFFRLMLIIKLVYEIKLIRDIQKTIKMTTELYWKINWFLCSNNVIPCCIPDFSFWLPFVEIDAEQTSWYSFTNCVKKCENGYRWMDSLEADIVLSSLCRYNIASMWERSCRK